MRDVRNPVYGADRQHDVFKTVYDALSSPPPDASPAGLAAIITAQVHHSLEGAYSDGYDAACAREGAA